MLLMMIRFYSVLLAGWLFIPLSVCAAPAQPSQNTDTKAFNLKTLQSLFESMKRTQAYAYARHYLPEMEGDPYFDYYYGVSAIDSGNASEGVFALERVLVSFPNDQVARLELARGYFILQQYAQARVSFEMVLQTNPPDQVRETALAYLDRIRVSESRYQTTHSGFIALGFGNDDNVNAGIDEDTPFFSSDSLAQDDNFTRLLGSWTFSHPFRPGWSFESSLNGDLRKNLDLDQFDTTTTTLQLGITHNQASSRYKAKLLVQEFTLDGDSYRSLNGLNLDWQYTITEHSSINTSIQYAQLDYSDFPLRNSNLTALGVNYLHSFSGKLQPMFFLSLSSAAEAADSNTIQAKADTERAIYSFRSGVILSFTNTLALQASIGTQTSDYEVPSKFFSLTTGLVEDRNRDDSYDTADLKLLWAFARKWRLDTQLNYTKNDSTLDIYDYERNVFEMSLNYTF